jgi:gliding motility-associated lipoprotein GldH
LINQKAPKTVRKTKKEEKEIPRKMIRRAILSLFFLMLIGCNSNEVYSEYKALPGYWPIEETIEFSIPALDSVSPYNLFFNLRNTNDYKYNNLFLITAIEFPNGKMIIDTLEYQMARADGSWLGTGNRVKENKLWYKENIRFFEEGSYAVRIRHAMRNNASVMGVSKLEGVIDVGIIVEKSQTESE